MEVFNADKYKDQVDSHGRPVLFPSVTVDAIVVRPTAAGHEILLITRGFEPFKGCLAFPGGFVDYNEDPINACLRELHEECKIKSSTHSQPTLVTVQGKPNRDPRKHVISIFYKVEVEATAQPEAGDDAATAQFYDLAEILRKKDQLSFDHGEVVQILVNKFYP